MHPAEKLAQELHNPALAQDENITHVIQVWEDGEITFQKNCDLLWCRNLHQMEPPCRYLVGGLKLPMEYNGHSYAYVTREDAYRIRALIQVKT